ncbi:hypothetical protein phiA047_0208 [Aeromonas phage phiA047]|nr:hypothetical protein phiA047_0208 [Aeromonas phage phiA047]
MKDTIKIKVEERSWEQPEEIYDENVDNYEETDNNVTKYDIECKVEINGNQIKHYTDLWAFFREFVEKADISNCAEYFGNTYKEVGNELVPITKSWHYNLTAFYPFTCSCGIAGCASIWDGIHVKWRKNSVEWRIKDKRDGYESILDKMFYSFDRKQYQKEVLTAYQTLCKLVENNPENESAWMVSEFKDKLKER